MDSPRVTLLKRKPGQYAGEVAGGDVTPPLPEYYEPMEAYGSLENITPTPIASNTRMYSNGSGWMIKGPTSPPQAIAWLDHVLQHVRLTCIPNFEGDSTLTPTFFMTVRMTDNLNFIGLRSYGGQLQVWESIDGIITKLCEYSNDGTVGKQVTLSAVLDRVKIRIDGFEVAEGVTTILNEGRYGAVPGAWTAGQMIIAHSYQGSDAAET